MLPKKYLRSSAFRLALGYVGLFGGSALVLLGFVYWATSAFMERQADATIEAEIAGLNERYRLTGLAGLTSSIRDRLDRRPAGSSIYLLTDGRYTPIVGNLDRWPTVSPDETGWLRFELGTLGGDDLHEARAKAFRLRGGFHLLVGRDLYDLHSLRKLLLRTTGWGLALTVALALGGAVLVSRSRVRRIGAINEAIDSIREGKLSARIPIAAGPASDDIDELVSKLNGMLDELERLVEGVRHVSDSIAHDLRTPLSRLKTHLERMRAAGSHDGDVLLRAIEEADNLLATFNALLRIARIEAGERRAGFAEVDLSALVQDVADLYGPLIEDAGHRLALRTQDGASMRGDRDLLFQALANLLDNAVKHTPPGGTIALTLALVRHGEEAEIVVADEGPGVPEKERARLTERFYRLDRSRSTPGVGLGLSLVSAVAALHQGRLVLESNEPGLRVVLKLPR